MRGFVKQGQVMSNDPTDEAAWLRFIIRFLLISASIPSNVAAYIQIGHESYTNNNKQTNKQQQ